MSRAACWRARRVSRAVSATVSLMAPMPGGQGCPGRAGTGASPRGMPRSAPLTFSSSFLLFLLLLPGAGGREGDVAARGVADGGTAELGERGQGGVPTGRVPGPGLGLVPGQDVLSGLEPLLNCYVGS